MKKAKGALSACTDAQLAGWVRNDNNAEAFEELVHRHTEFISAKLGRMLHDEDLVKDGMQEVWCAMYTGLRAGHYNEKDKFRNWIRQIAWNKAHDMLDEEVHYHGKTGEHPLPGEPYEEPDEGGDDDEYAKRAYHLLNPLSASIVEMHRQQDMTSEEIGAALHLKAATVRKRYERALKAMLYYVQMMKQEKVFAVKCHKTPSKTDYIYRRAS